MNYSFKAMEIDFPVKYLPEFACLIAFAKEMYFDFSPNTQIGFNENSKNLWLCDFDTSIYSIAYNVENKKILFVANDFDTTGEFIIDVAEMRQFLNNQDFTHQNINDLFHDLLVETEKGRFDELSNAVKKTFVKF